MKQVNRANSIMARLFSEGGMPLGSFLFVMCPFPLRVLRLKEIRQRYQKCVRATNGLAKTS